MLIIRACEVVRRSDNIHYYAIFVSSRFAETDEEDGVMIADGRLRCPCTEPKPALKDRSPTTSHRAHRCACRARSESQGHKVGQGGSLLRSPVRRSDVITLRILTVCIGIRALCLTLGACHYRSLSLALQNGLGA